MEGITARVMDEEISPGGAIPASRERGWVQEDLVVEEGGMVMEAGEAEASQKVSGGGVKGSHTRRWGRLEGDRDVELDRQFRSQWKTGAVDFAWGSRLWSAITGVIWKSSQ